MLSVFDSKGGGADDAKNAANSGRQSGSRPIRQSRPKQTPAPRTLRTGSPGSLIMAPAMLFDYTSHRKRIAPYSFKTKKFRAEEEGGKR